MPAKRKKEEINLLPEKGFQATTTGRILIWILSTFRVIVIVTEIIVMVAFLSRFWLDAQNSDLNEKITQKQAVLSASQAFEKEFKDTQKKLEVFSVLTSSQVDSSIVLEKITQALPPDVILTNITLTKDRIEISGNTPNERSIHQLSVNLNSTNEMAGFETSKINTNLNNPTLLDFQIRGLLEKQKT